MASLATGGLAGIDATSWPALKALLDQALDLEPAARDAWLEGLGAEHAALQPVLRRLLAQDDASRFETLPRLDDPPAMGEPPRPPDAGPYHPLRLLGEGGMGTVWLAERTDVMLRRPVALKLPRASWRHPGLAQRLAQEREILAVLDHPHIARLYDAGVADDGQPYLALEYIDGQRIDDYCRNRALDLRQRVQLFLQVVQAVAHAHAKLVVHRDLKPGNILVTSDGQARLLDFGVAKLLGEPAPGAADLTGHAGRPMTPMYAAPEQILGQPIGTAADIYALGVVLYELLTGQRPYQPARDTNAALEDAVLNQEPRRPSEAVSDPRLVRRLRGDLDTIVGKALKKSPQARYETANALADDLENWLGNRPVRARPDDLRYLALKFMVRHRVALGVAGALVLTLAVGLAAATWQAQRARLEAAKATAIKDYLLGLFQSNDIDQQDAIRRRQQSVQQLLEGSVDSLLGPMLDAQPQVQGELRQVVGGLLYELELTGSAIRVQQARVVALDADEAPPGERAAARRELALSQMLAGDGAATRATLERAAADCAAGGADDTVPCLMVQVEHGAVDFNDRRLPAALARVEPALQSLRRAAPDSLDLADALYTLALLRVEAGQREPALHLLEESTALQRRLRAHQPVRLALWRYRIARSLWKLGYLARAEQELIDTLDVARRAFGPAHPATARIELSLGRLTLYLGLRPDGLEHIRHASTVLLRPEAALDPSQVLEAHIVLANALLLQGRLAEAAPALERALALRSSLGEAGFGDPTLDQTQARLLLDRGRFDEALAWLESFRARTVAMHGTAQHPDVAERLVRIADVRIAQGQPAQAQQALDAAFAVLDAAGGGSAVRQRATLSQAELLIEQGRAGQAMPLIDAQLERVRMQPRADQFRDPLYRLHDLAARAAAALGQTERARAGFEQAIALLAPTAPGHPYLAATRGRYAAFLAGQGPAAHAPAQRQLALAQSALDAAPEFGPQFRAPLEAARAALGPTGR